MSALNSEDLVFVTYTCQSHVIYDFVVVYCRIVYILTIMSSLRAYSPDKASPLPFQWEAHLYVQYRHSTRLINSLCKKCIPPTIKMLLSSLDHMLKRVSDITNHASNTHLQIKANHKLWKDVPLEHSREELERLEFKKEGFFFSLKAGIN